MNLGRYSSKLSRIRLPFSTGSEKGKRILDNFEEYLPKFKKIIPHDYKKMMSAIASMEEKGMSSDQAQIEAFYQIINGKQ